MSDFHFDTEGSILALRALESALFDHPDVVEHTIWRAKDRALDLRVVCTSPDRVTDLFQRAQAVARMATEVQGFPQVRIVFEAAASAEWPPPPVPPPLEACVERPPWWPSPPPAPEPQQQQQPCA